MQIMTQGIRFLLLKQSELTDVEQCTLLSRLIQLKMKVTRIDPKAPLASLEIDLINSEIELVEARINSQKRSDRLRTSGFTLIKGGAK